MKNLLLSFLILISLNSFSQTGRIRQSITIVVWYEVLPNHTYDIYVRNAAKDTSLIQYIFNDTTFTVRLGHWEKIGFRTYQPNGFTLLAKNISNYFGEWEECGSVKQIDGVKIDHRKSKGIVTDCRGRFPVFGNDMRQ